ncbi:MAG: Ig-like domain-containing protein [Thalassobaculum sp.]
MSAPDLVAGSDTGASSTDNITEDTTPTFTGTAEAGSVVSLLVNGVTVAGGVAATGTGAWTLTAGSLAAGSYFLQTSAQDAAGNVTTSSGLGVTIGDTTPPTVSAPDLLAFNDSGVSSTDNLTNASVLGFQGTTEAGAAVSLLVDGVTVSSGTAITLFGGTLTAGAWNLSAFSLSEGSHFVQAVATDAAGNSTTSSGLEIVIDRTAPTVSAPDLVAGSDTGASDTDNITEDTTPTFTGTAEAGSFVSLLVNGVTAAGGIAATGTGAWTLTAGSLAAGSYFVQTSAQDAAGNVATSAGLGVTIGDTTPPTVSAPDLVAFRDSGISSTDNLTNASVLEFQGTTEVGAAVSLLVDGVTVSSGTAITLFGGTLTAGAWTLSAFSLSEGSHFVQAVATDAAGNSTTSSGLEIVIDRTAPTVSAPDLVAGSDTGASSTDNITEDTTPTFTGTAEAGSVVSLLVNGVTVAGGIAATGTGAWTLTAATLAAGSYFVQTSAQDAAGNVTTSAGLGVVIGTGATSGADTLVGTSAGDTIDGLAGDDLISGLAGNDLLIGNDGSDTLSGGANADTLSGGTGADLVVGGGGFDVIMVSGTEGEFDTISGGAGTDTLASSTGDIVLDGFGAAEQIEVIDSASGTLRGNANANLFDLSSVTWAAAAGTVLAGFGDDTVIGTAQDDSLHGEDGADALSGGAGFDLLVGGTGDDTLVGGAQADTLSGGAGVDSIVAGGGFDVILVGGAEDAFDTLLGGAGTDTLRSTSGDIVLDGFGAANEIEVIDSATGAVLGTSGANLLDLSSVVWASAVGSVSGGGGDDTLIGTGGDDGLFGGDGNDLLSGGAGFDLLVGGSGSDTLIGGGQADTLSGGEGADSIVGSGGFDLFMVNGSDGIGDTLVGGAGTDTLRSSTGDIVLDGFGSAEQIEVIDAASGFVVGTDGDNLFDLSAVSWAAGTGGISGGEGADSLYGTGGDDSLFGDNGNDLLSGGAGFDLLVGGSGSDTLIGGGQADTLSGGEGADSIVGSGGFDLFMVNGSDGIGDTLVGGAGTDTLRSSTGDVVLDGFGPAEQIEVIDAASGFVVGTDGDNLFDLSAVSWAAGTGGISGGEGADSLYGTGGDDSLFGDNGNDLLSGGAGFDLLVGGSGSDTLIGGGQADTLSGGEGADTLSGSGGFDLMVGGDGDDLLDGGAGSDTLSGGTGADTFVAGQADRIEDFTNQDAIQVSGVFGSGDISTGFAAGVTTLSISGGPDIVLVGDYSGIGFEVSDDGTNTTIILDSTPPTVSAPDLIASSDTGTPDNDVTEDATPTFAGTAEAGSTVNLLVNGATVATTVANSVTGTWTLTSSSLAGGTYNVQAEAEDAAGNIATSTGLSVTVVNSGSVIDGYVAGATVFADTNGNLTLDAGEVSATTDVGGNFTIAASGPLVSFGGTDISTGLAFDGLMSAPAGYTVVTPVTTLVERLVTSGGAADTAAAETQVRTAFGIDGSVDLASFDPIAQAIAGNAAANAVVTASVVIQSTLALSAALVAGASGQSEAAAYDAAARSLAAAMTADPALDLTDTAAIQSVVSGTATQLGVTDPTALANVATASAGTAQIIAGLNATTLTVASSGTQLVTDMAQVTVVANGDAADAVETAGSTGTTEAIGAAVDSYTGSNLSTAIDAAEVGDIDGGEIGGDADDLIGGTGGNDVIDGGGGNDTLRGFSGDDVISGGDGADRVLGNRGDDTLYGGAGEDFVHGGKGDDVLIVNGTGDVYDDLHGGWGEDTLRSLDGDIVLDGFAFDSIEVIDSATGVLRGTADANFMYLNGSAWFEGTGTVAAGDGNDWVVGTGGGDTLLGEGDNDRLFGGGGGDSIVGGDGDDFMLGNFGDDTIVAGGGDFAHGGLGDDVIRFDGLLAGDRADLNGGFGDNVLELALTAAQLSDASVQDDLADLDRWIDRGSRGTFDFDSLNLRLRAFDDYTLI